MSGSHELQPAPLGRRVAARLVDTLLFIVAPVAVAVAGWAIASYVAFKQAFYGALQTSEDEGVADAAAGFLADIALLWLILGAFAIALVLIFIRHVNSEVWSSRRAGQTPGKRLMGIRIVRSSSGGSADLGAGQLFVRWLVLHGAPFAAAVIAGLAAGDSAELVMPLAGAACLAVVAVPALLAKPGCGVHDRLAGTMVIDVRNLPADHPVRPSTVN